MKSTVEHLNQQHIEALSPKARLERCAAMLQWTREMLARQIESEIGPVSSERLKWEVAKRLYVADATAQILIDRKLADVSH
jgi:hypothetical protein